MPDLKLTLPARPDNVAVVRHAFAGLGEALALDEQLIADIKLAVTEACTNVVVHAYEDQDGPLAVEAWLRHRDRLEVVVRDEGAGILPLADNPGLGLGLPLIATLSNGLEFRKNEQQHTELRMIFSLNGSAAEVSA